MERKDINRLFQEKFKDFEVTPPEHVWEKIEAELKEKKKRRIIPFWFQLTGIAAALILAFLLTGRFIANESAPENGVVLENNNSQKPQQNDVDKGANIASPASGSIHQDNAVVNTPEPVSGSVKSGGIEGAEKTAGKGVNPKTIQEASGVAASGNQPATDKTSDRQFKRKHNNFQKRTIDAVAVKKASGSMKNNRTNDIVTETETTIAESGKTEKSGFSNGNQEKITPVPEKGLASETNTSGNREKEIDPVIGKDIKVQTDSAVTIADPGTKKDTVAIAAVPNALEELSKEKEQEVTKKEQKINRWQVTSNVAPIYFSSTSNGSPLDSRFATSNKSYKPTVSYGVGVQYALNKSLAVRAGVHSLALEYSTNDVVFFQTPNARKIENLRPNLQGSLLEVSNNPGELSMQSVAGKVDSKFEGSLNQKTGYIEVPVELSYKVLDRRLGIEVIGGVSTMFLNQNEVSLISSGMDMNIGEADNLNSLHFSTNLGLGFRYKIFKTFQANFEPVFKYQINTFSNDAGNFKPYFFGLYTGLSYRF